MERPEPYFSSILLLANRERKKTRAHEGEQFLKHYLKHDKYFGFIFLKSGLKR
jgi:hypothetical protein